MILTYDISKHNWASENLEDKKEILFSFKDNGRLPVYLSNINFGYSILDKDNEIYSNPDPFNGFNPEYTDQEFIYSYSTKDLAIGKTYEIKVWANNNGEIAKESFTFILPKPPQPYPSWKYNKKLNIWEPPIEYPAGGGMDYEWDEETTSWKKIT